MTTKVAVLEADYRGPGAEFVRVFRVPWEHRELAARALLGSAFVEARETGEGVVPWPWPEHVCWRVVVRAMVVDPENSE